MFRMTIRSQSKRPLNASKARHVLFATTISNGIKAMAWKYARSVCMPGFGKPALNFVYGLLRFNIIPVVPVGLISARAMHICPQHASVPVSQVQSYLAALT